jgi:hypothetical protein
VDDDTFFEYGDEQGQDLNIPESELLSHRDRERTQRISQLLQSQMHNQVSPMREAGSGSSSSEEAKLSQDTLSFISEKLE